MSMTRAFLLITVSTVVVAASACEPRDRTYSDTASGRVDLNSSVRVADVTLGRNIGPDRKIINEMDTFAPTDTIYASVRTSGSGTGMRLTARWMFEDSTLVQEQSETISPTGDAFTHFHITKASPWPKGKYTLRLLLDGREVETETFTVK